MRIYVMIKLCTLSFVTMFSGRGTDKSRTTKEIAHCFKQHVQGRDLWRGKKQTIKGEGGRKCQNKINKQ